MSINYNNSKEKLEIEAKFICPDGLAFDNLLVIVDAMGCQYIKEIPFLQTDVYFDTPGYTLLNSDAALRIRQRGENYIGTYKVSGKQHGTIFERREFEWVLSSNEIKLWNEERKPTIPPKILEKLNLQGQILRKVLVAETQRNTATLVGNDGFKAELSLDVVTFRGHKGQKTYREIEIELLNGQFEQLKQFANSLQNQLKLQLAVDSKYKMGMISVGKYGTKAQ